MVDDVANGKFYMNTYTGVVDSENHPIGLAVLTEDVTERRKLELQQASDYKMMEETSNNLRIEYHELLLATLETITKVLEKRDPYTCNHSVNVCKYTLKMYEHRFGIGIEYRTLQTAATLHDIGKVGIPDMILHKPGKLTPEEFDIIKHHPVISEEILKPLDSGGSISKIVRYHHERFDGSGYPDGLDGNDIPMASRLIALADAFDAMYTDRPYRRALSFQSCVDAIKTGRGNQFDPEWVDVFLDLIYTGSL